jgi:hypothetical protein
MVFPKDFPTNLKSDNVSDIVDCAKGQEQIEKGNCKKISYLVSYTEHINKDNGRKTIAGQVKIRPADVKAVQFCF